MSSTLFIRRIRSIIVTGFVSTAVLCLVGSVPLSAYAIDTTSTSCADPATAAGVARPNGADAATYTYNCAGYWENDHFIYNPSDGVYRNKVEPTYTYNAVTGKYDYPVWVYNAPSNAYVSETNAINIPPAGATVVGAPGAASAPSVSTTDKPAALGTSPSGGQSIATTGAASNNQIAGDGTGGAAAITSTGGGSNNHISASGKDQLTGNFTTVATVNNTLNTQANSGTVTLAQNTTAGDALSGNASAMANVVNLLQSTSNALGKNGNVTTFVSNIKGDVNGDLLLNPADLGSIQPATAQPVGKTDLTINDSTSANINNNLKVTAASGDTTATQNTTAGNAASGNAQAVANIVNIIDSAVSAGKSFLGVINIHGNLNGDILLPPNFVDQLLAANVPTVSIATTGANSNNQISNTGGQATTVSNSSNAGINNAVTAAATSGNVNSSENTTAGNATSGNANTNMTAFNLTGSSVIGGNDLLVFVNVLGTWVGLIVNAPAGATAASLGGGITQNIPAGTSTMTFNRNANEQINNTVTATAKSGDVTQTQNTTAGNATSGDAKTAVNLLNIAHSSLSLSNWFGVLFINVFGSWHGSFGINTAFGDPAISPTENLERGGPAAPTTARSNASRVFTFVARPDHSDRNATRPAPTAPDSTVTNQATSPLTGVTLGSHTIRAVATTPSIRPNARASWFVPAVVIGSMMLLFLVSDGIAALRSKATK